MPKRKPRTPAPAAPAPPQANAPGAPEAAKPSTLPAAVPPPQQSPAAVTIADKLGLKIDEHGNLDIASLAYVLQTSKLFPDIQTVSQGIVKIQVGREIGVGPMQSVMGIHIIRDEKRNKTSIMVGAHLVAAKIKGSGRYDFDVLQLDPFGCELQPYTLRNNEWRPLKKISFTLDEAKTAGYGGWGYEGRQSFKAGSNWAKDSQAMCFARAVTRCEKVHFADLTGLPVYTPDELGYRADEAGEPLMVRGQLIPDDMAPEEEARLREATPVPQQPRRATISYVAANKLSAVAKDHGWPLVDMLEMIFQQDGYVDATQALAAWEADAYQRLLELIAEDRYDALLKVLETAFADYKRSLEQVANNPSLDSRAVGDEALRRDEGSPLVGKTAAAAIVEELHKNETKPASGETDRPKLETTAPKTETKGPPPKPKPDPTEMEIAPDQYDELWTMAVDAACVPAVKAFAKTLGYRTLRQTKVKDLHRIIEFIQQQEKKA